MRKPHVAVIGAGAFGGWTALSLLRRGAKVALVDAWGPGNPRSSSGGETRVIRGTYGPDQPYTQMTARAMQLWDKNQRLWERNVFHRVGVLWMAAAADDQFERGSLPLLRDAGIEYEELSVKDLSKRWPQINLDGVHWAIYEPECGYLEAQAACLAVFDEFRSEGGTYQQATVQPCESSNGDWLGITLPGAKLEADAYVFACGPWMGKLFPRTIGPLVRSTKQDLFFFGTPPGDDSFSNAKLPVWADHRDHFVYGIPGAPGCGFKIGDDTRGVEFDPTDGERTVSEDGLIKIRQYLEYRFPAMKGAPLLESRVCQYENTPDNHFILDRHPATNNVWIVGGGSGHGFKHGPVIGEMVAEMVMDGREADAIFRLARLGT